MPAMLRIISLNLNGIRSAWSKNLLPWQRDLFVKSYSRIADVAEALRAAYEELRGEEAANDGAGKP